MRIGTLLLAPWVLLVFGCELDPSSVEGLHSNALPIGMMDGGVECAHPEENCECDPGQPPIDCYLEAIEDENGLLTCNAGQRYCRQGLWSACESVRGFAIRQSGSALVTGPDLCNPCNPRCFVSRDVPGPADLGSNADTVVYDSDRGGIRLGTLPIVPEILVDTDGDGIPDVADECVGNGAFLAADGSCYGDRFIFHMLPYGESGVDTLDIRTQIRTADIYFLMDTTGSMGGELDRLQSDLTSGNFISGCSGGIMGAIRCTIPDAWFGVGYFDDYPVSPYGTSSDRVYRNVRDLDANLSGAQSAVNSLAIHNGNDGPESNTQALWAVATGGGLSSYLSARTNCPASRWGYPCFRDGTIPIVIHITDAPFHNGPDDAYPYCIGGSIVQPGLPSATSITNNNERMDNTAYPGSGNAVDITGRWIGFSGSTQSMANDFNFGCNSGSREAVFRVRLTSPQLTRFSLEGSSFDTVLGVIPVSGGSSYCNDDAVGNQSRLDLSLPAGDYWVVVDGYSSGRGNYRLSMGLLPAAYCSGNSGVSWEDTVDAIAARQLRVITVQTCGSWSTSYCLEGESHARTLGNATGSLGSSGSPYVFRGSSSGAGLSNTIVDAVVDLANYSRMNVSARAVGDTRGFTRTPIAAVSWGVGGCAGISGGTTFLQCLPGTQVNFRVTFRNDVVPSTMTTQVFTFFIELVGDGTVVLARVPVRIVVPALVSAYPPRGSYFRDYDSTSRCAFNERPDWGTLSWDADIPAGTRIEFELQAANAATGLASGAVGRVSTPPTASPIDLAAALRTAGYPNGMRHLRVKAVLYSSTGGTASPALRNMAVTYNCLPAE